MKIARILALVTITVLISSGRGQDSDPTPLCNKENEQFTECASSTCFEGTCADLHQPMPGLMMRKKCTLDCRQGCQCKPGFYRNFDGRCVDELSCLMCGYGELWLDCGAGRGGCEEDEYELTCDIIVNENGGVLPIKNSGCKCDNDFYRSPDGICISETACENCGVNEEWEECGSSTCWEFNCDDIYKPFEDRWPRSCTLDCREGCKCHTGFFRDKDSGECLTPEKCAEQQKV